MISLGHQHGSRAMFFLKRIWLPWRHIITKTLYSYNCICVIWQICTRVRFNHTWTRLACCVMSTHTTHHFVFFWALIQLNSSANIYTIIEKHTIWLRWASGLPNRGGKGKGRRRRSEENPTPFAPHFLLKSHTLHPSSLLLDMECYLAFNFKR